MLVVLLVLPLVCGYPVRDSNIWETEEHGVEGDRSGYIMKEMGVLDRREMKDEGFLEGQDEDDEYYGESTGTGISQVEIGEDDDNVYILLPKLRVDEARLKERGDGPMFEEAGEEQDLDILEDNAIRLLGLLNRRDLMTTDAPQSQARDDDIWRIGEEGSTDESEEEADHVEIGENEGKIYILLPKLRAGSDKELLRELSELDSPLFGEGDQDMDGLEQKTIRLLHEALESRIQQEDSRERDEDEREREEDEREELWKRSNEIEIDEGVNSYRIMMPKQEKLGRIKLGNWVARGAGGKEVRIKGQGDGRGGHTIYRSSHGDFDEVNMF